MFTINLDEQDHELLAEVILDPTQVQNGRSAARLFNSLKSKGLIPAVRLRMFADDNYSPMRGASSRSSFIKNGHSDDTLLEHPHFLKHLKYFIYGPNLPTAVFAEIKNELDDLGDITSSDHVTLRSFIRKITRDHKLQKTDSDEIFQLIIELTGDVYLASELRKEVMKVSAY